MRSTPDRRRVTSNNVMPRLLIKASTACNGTRGVHGMHGVATLERAPLQYPAAAHGTRFLADVVDLDTVAICALLLAHDGIKPLLRYAEPWESSEPDPGF